MAGDTEREALKAQLLASELAVPTSGLGRLWRSGRGAVGLARATLTNRLRGAGKGLTAGDVDAIARLVERLGELRGVAMKAGQILSYADPSLPEELQRLLSLLQVSAPASPFASVAATLREELGARAEPLLAAMERTPVAVASIGQVHRARLPDGTELAVKVRHRGIEEALRSDFAVAERGSLLAGVLVPGALGSVRGMLEEARAALLEECDYRLEAARQETFGRLLANHPVLLVPRVVEGYSARAVLVSAWLPGQHLDDWLAQDPPQRLRDLAGTALFELYFGTLYRHGFFHADPHPGNYGFRASGDALRLAVYDFGCVRTFERPAEVGKASSRSLSLLLSAVRSDDASAIDLALRALGAAPKADRATQQVQRALLRSFFAPMLEAGPHAIARDEGSAARDILRDKRALMRLGLPGSMLFLFRLRFGLYAVLARLGAVADWAALEARWADQARRDERAPSQSAIP
jgi:predicted unusual protein kinase regulating ubiquinone biosynthesis (AarF/ABC1/UbiB family)